jgi:putative heme-binding domain-containing protein
MRSRCLAGILGVVAFLLAWSWLSADTPPAPEVQWVWFPEGDPAASAPAETRYFLRVFTIDHPGDKPVTEAALEITADNEYIVWINGTEVGKGDDWNQVNRFDVRKLLIKGKNVIAVQAHNQGGPAGLMARLTYVPTGGARRTLVTDGEWLAAKTAGDGWRTATYDAKKWSPVKVLGPVGKAGPWQNLAWGTGGKSGPTPRRFTVPDGFRVEEAVKIPENDPKFSLINMTFDARGRLLVSREGGPIFLCTNPDKDGVLQDAKPYCTQVKGSHGMCWVKDALLLVGDGPQGTGLYRCRDTKGADAIDEVTLLHKFRGGMGEHGPHAVLHGPDGWLYLVIGNHAGAQPQKLAGNSPLTRWPTGGPGPDQGKPGTTEDVLLKRLNDAHGHAADICAPGGTIWRLDPDGKNMSLVNAGFRNHFDAVFSPNGELFTFDSDMEWDENLPWYRAVRVEHCPPGADFVWRTGAANTPDYYIDSLPPVLETGRGSPVGLEFYDYPTTGYRLHGFPEKYQGAFFMADWSIGVIWAVHLERQGASYKGKAEKFCVGTPMNVTDLAVAPNGSLYFTVGGRGSQGGVYRIVAAEPKTPMPTPGPAPWSVESMLDLPQPLAAWQRDMAGPALTDGDRKALVQGLEQAARNPALPLRQRLKALTVLQIQLHVNDAGLNRNLLKDREAEVRGFAVWLLGLDGAKEHGETLVQALQDEDALVRRRTCEALIRAGIEPPVEAIYPLLGDKDRFVRTAARLVLQRIDPEKWAGRLWKEPNDIVAYEGIVALCKIDRAASYAEQIFTRLQAPPSGETQTLVDYLRTVELALVHAGSQAAPIKAIAAACEKLFPQKDWRTNRELAILLTYFQITGLLDRPVQPVLVRALLDSKDDRLQQIHYFYCLRLLRKGWEPEQARAVAEWYDTTKTWTGGFSFTPFLENIFRELVQGFSLAEKKRIVEQGDKLPLPCLVLAQRLQTEPQPELLPALSALSDRLAKNSTLPRGADLRKAVAAAVVKTVGPAPTAETWPLLVRGLESDNPVLLFELVGILLKSKIKPKPDDAAAYRALLLASRGLDEKSRWKAVELLRHWSGGRSFGADDGDWKPELVAWAKWYGQAFPKEPALPDTGPATAAESKYKYDELLAFVEKDPAGKKGDVARGRQVFEKAQCLKCHKFGKDGEGIGPDLTTLRQRFKRADILESIYYPSKVISDQYRSSVIVTKKGQQLTGLAAPVGDTVTVLQSDGTKVTLRKDEIEQQYASLVSAMPEKLLDPLTKEEIADLFAFLESEPGK